MRSNIIKAIGILLLAIPFTAKSQSFLGPHLSQYDPLKAVYFNPGALPNSDMRWQVNILSADVSVGNDFLRLTSLKGIFKKEFDPYRFFEVNMNGQDKNLNINSDIRGPGFMINFGRNSFAFGTRIKEVASVNDFDEDFAYSLFHHYNDIISYLPAFNNSHASAAVNAYAEYSIAYARKFIKGDRHELSAGVNFKVLDKIFYASLDARNIRFNKFEYLLDTAVNVYQSEFDLLVSNDYENGSFKYKWGIDGWAIDAGVEYLFKPTALAGNYRLKIGVALNDFGTLRQEYGTESFNFKGNDQIVHQSSFVDGNGDINSFQQVLDSIGTRTAIRGKKNITLPSTLHVYADVKIIPKVYIYGGVQVNPYNFKNKVGLANLPSKFTIVPRFDTKKIGVYAPVSWDKYDSFTSGVGVRVGQFSLGSANIISSIVKNKYTGVDLYLSLAIGGKRRTEKI
ncbi:MAG TPA: DUF5723 family protein [Chitinophagales bacterium]|nr:DUF5723 family protein [Chitinophagales bacterium]